MADELIENAEFGKKHKNEEDPILVAQRFLNIYRQMHIFNEERRNQFDDMLLELQPDVRILLSTLPGGSLLLEHIEELEQKRGLVSAPIKKENSFRKKTSQELAGNDHSAERNAKATVGSVVIDSSFASELSSSLSLALQQTEKRYKDDIKTLTETITQSIMASQSAIANMMKDILIAAKNKNSGNDNVSFKAVPDEPTPQPVLNTNPPIENTAATTETTTHAFQTPLPDVKTEKSAENTSQPVEKVQPETVAGKPAKDVSKSAETSLPTAVSKEEKQPAQIVQEEPSVEKNTDNAGKKSDKKAAAAKKNQNDAVEPSDEPAQTKPVFFQSVRNRDSITEDFPEKESQKFMQKTEAVETSKTEAEFFESSELEKEAKADTSLSAENDVSVPTSTEIAMSEELADTVKEDDDTKQAAAEKPLNFGKITSLASDLAKKIGKNKKGKKTNEAEKISSDVLSEDNADKLDDHVITEEKTAAEVEQEPSSQLENTAQLSDMPIEAEADKSLELSVEKVADDISHAIPLTEDVSSPDTKTPAVNKAFDFDDMLNDIKINNRDLFAEDSTMSAAETNDDNALYKNELSQIREALQEPEPTSEKDAPQQENPATPKKKPTEKNKHDSNDVSSQGAFIKSAPALPELSDELISLDDLPDTPISLDDISEDPISLDDFDDENNTEQNKAAQTNASYSNPSDEQDWEWEYVDDNGNENNDEDWEWEYVEDDGNGDENSEDWEWEYVEDGNDSDENKK